jgi:hypothetical protein
MLDPLASGQRPLGGCECLTSGQGGSEYSQEVNIEACVHDQAAAGLSSTSSFPL